MGKLWYVIEFLPLFGSRATAERHLRRDGFEPWVPVNPVTKRDLFSGYGFLPLDLSADGWGRVYSTRGVSHMLPRYEMRPRPLPTAFVDELRLALDGYSEPVEVVKRWCRGDLVPITSGPFAGFNGVMEGRHRGALVLLLSLLGRENVIEVPEHHCGRPPVAPPMTGRFAEPGVGAAADAS